MLYLDAAATTQMDVEVAVAMQPFMADEFANPAAAYSLAEEEHKAVEIAREQLAYLIGAKPDEIYFTSGGTESNNWVLHSATLGKKKHIVTSAVEHPSVRRTCEFLEAYKGCRITFVPVDETGMVDVDNVTDAIESDTAIVSIMHANNEVGTIQPVEWLSDVCRDKGVLLHTDAVQTVGKVAIDVDRMGVDALSLSGHKFYGPKGVGALFIRGGLNLLPFIHGGGQESGLRGGTSNVPWIVGLGKAAEVAERFVASGKSEKLTKSIDRFWSLINNSDPTTKRNGHFERRVPNILSVTFPDVECNRLIFRLDHDYQIYCSCGSACHAQSVEPSQVLLAMGLGKAAAHSTVRFSIDRCVETGQLESAAYTITGLVARLRSYGEGKWKL